MKRFALAFLVFVAAQAFFTRASYGAFVPTAARVVWAASGNTGAIVTDGMSMVVIKMDGTALSTIKLDSPLFGMEFSPDGGKIAYATQSGLSISNADGSGAIKLETARCQGLHWSADGSVLFYMSIIADAQNPQHGQLAAYVVHADGTGKVKIYTASY